MVIFVVDWWFADTFGVCLEDFVIDWCFFYYYYCLGICVVAFMVDWWFADVFGVYLASLWLFGVSPPLFWCLRGVFCGWLVVC